LIQLENADPSRFKLELRIQFSDEEGLDFGGVRKEWFQLLTHDLFKEDYGMFTLNKQSQNYWFCTQSDSLQDFKLVGMLMGLALYNSVVLDVHFPKFLYRYIHHAIKNSTAEPNISFTLKDLEDIDPDLFNGLNELLNYEGDVEEDFGLDFSVTTSVFGQAQVHELKPGGVDIPVTRENREEFVNLRTKWILLDSIKGQLKAFINGFLLVVDSHSPAVRMVTSGELEVLICGERVLDWDELEQSVVYENGYSKDHPLIKQFWAYFRELPEESKKQFLRFSTGSDRCPVGGLKNSGLIIARHGDDSKLPTASTCSAHFFLPEYKSAEDMKKKVSQAIQYNSGFGLL